MIFVFADDQTLNILDSIDEVRRDCEGVDVEEGIFSFFDESGSLLLPYFIESNKKGKLFGLFGWVSSGVFDLKKSEEDIPYTIEEALDNTVSIDSNKYFDSLAAVRGFLTNKSCQGREKAAPHI
jgi:hypothetical protein